MNNQDTTEIEVKIIDVLRELKTATPFFLNKKVRSELNYPESEELKIDTIIKSLIKDRVIIRSDDLNYNYSKNGTLSLNDSELRLFLNEDFL